MRSERLSQNTKHQGGVASSAVQAVEQGERSNKAIFAGFKLGTRRQKRFDRFAGGGVELLGGSPNRNLRDKSCEAVARKAAACAAKIPLKGNPPRQRYSDVWTKIAQPRYGPLSAAREQPTSSCVWYYEFCTAQSVECVMWCGRTLPHDPFDKRRVERCR